MLDEAQTPNLLSASEARNLCPPRTTDQVFGDVRSTALLGGRNVVMQTALLLPETRQELSACGYSIRDSAGHNGDLTVIEW